MLTEQDFYDRPVTFYGRSAGERPSSGTVALMSIPSCNGGGGVKLKWGEGIDWKSLLPCCIASSFRLAAPNVTSSVAMTGSDNLNDDCINL